MKGILLACVVVVAGCGKKAESPPLATPEPAATIAKPATGDAPSAPAAEMDHSKNLERLTQTVRKYAAEMRTAPKSLDEVVRAGYLPEMPLAPPGKRYVIDDQLRVQLK